MAYSENQMVEVLWYPGHRSQFWRKARVVAVREHSLAVRPGCVQVYIDGPALGRYDIPLDRVRPVLDPSGSDHKA